MEPQVSSVSVKRPGRSVLPLSRGPGLAGFWGTFSPPRISVPGEQRAYGAVSVTLDGMSGQQALVLCPRLQIQETTDEPSLMQTPEDFFTSWSLSPSVPNTAEQGFGP